MTVSVEFGLVNAANRYLTAEPFRFQVAATGKQLKPRQVWILQFVTPHGAGAAGPGEGAGQKLHLISALKRYLAADTNGKVTCDQDKPGPQTFFLLHQYPDGKVTLQNEQSKRFLGGAEENVTCFAQVATETEKWTLHLAVHPNVAIYSPNRKRYLRCDDKAGMLRCDRDMPWGAESVITLYYDFVVKKYGLRNGGGKLLASNGSLVPEITPQTLYSLEVNGGLVAFRDEEGKYLTGREGGMRAIKMDKPGRDELFSMESSPAQVSIRSSSTSKFICCRPGADLYANAMAVGNTEIFQLLFDDTTKKVCFRGYCGTYMSLGPNDCIVSGSKQDKNVWFDLQYQEQKVSLRIGDKYVSMRPNGQLLAIPKVAGKSEDFLLVLVNRPLLVLHSDAGYVGLGNSVKHLEANCVSYVASSLSLTEEGYYNFQIGNNYWALDKDGQIMAASDHPSNFTIQFASSSCLILKASNNKFIVAEQGGRFWAGASDSSNATLFHY
ncbi:fascin-like isoform X2 [Hemicordylus capensis]|uniref:fascin-like isoform X2 n=1 Tax=Hemicordylus capensis TaxID=884348 RepID=UPI002302E673|nr:fascin-like isoform X2 [Hemicordylus capensis]